MNAAPATDYGDREGARPVGMGRDYQIFRGSLAARLRRQSKGGCKPSTPIIGGRGSASRVGLAFCEEILREPEASRERCGERPMSEQRKRRGDTVRRQKGKTPSKTLTSEKGA